MTRPDGSLRWTFEVNPSSKFRVVVTADPENVKAVLATRFSDFGKGADFHDVFESLFGEGIFSVDGQEWQAARKLMRPLFSKDRLVDTTVFEKHTQRLISALGGSRNFPPDNRVVDIQPILYDFTLDASVDYLVGYDMASIVKETEFSEAFDYLRHRVGVFMRAQSVFPLSEIVSRVTQFAYKLTGIFRDSCPIRSTTNSSESWKISPGHSFSRP